MRGIDINCDLGEGLANEELLMPLISSCNIACGAHAGSIEIMDKVLSLAQNHHVKIGAHPSFPDRENFGRVIMNISDDELKMSLMNQLTLFRKRADKLGVQIHHIKPHGALYNLISVDKKKAQLVVDVIKEVFGVINMYVPYQSETERVAIDNGMRIVYEAFADRNYNDDLTLVSRSQPNAILIDSEDIVQQVKRMVLGTVRTISGKEITIKADTFCIHGDNPKVLNSLKKLHQHFIID